MLPTYKIHSIPDDMDFFIWVKEIDGIIFRIKLGHHLYKPGTYTYFADNLELFSPEEKMVLWELIQPEMEIKD